MIMNKKDKRTVPVRVFEVIKFMISKAPPLKRFLYGLIGYLLYHEEFRRSLSDKNIFLIGTPEHGNLGDHAIAYATREYLHNILPEFNIGEISEERFFKYTYCLKRYCKRSDLFILSGGGNIGNQYINPEQVRRCVIQQFPRNNIIIFPQTIYFTNDQDGRKEQKKSFKIYNKHKNLTITAREQYSHAYLREHMPNKQILITPDMVFNLEKSDSKAVRDGAVLCFRKDRERILKDRDADIFRQCLGKYFDEIISLDTTSVQGININERIPALEELWSIFVKARLVVTDRLHGMIFAAITGTPCIAVSNYNQKIKGSYQWIEQLPYIRYLEEPDQFEEAVRQLYRLPEDMKYNSGFAAPYFEKLKAAVLR